MEGNFDGAKIWHIDWYSVASNHRIYTKRVYCHFTFTIKLSDIVAIGMYVKVYSGQATPERMACAPYSSLPNFISPKVV